MRQEGASLGLPRRLTRLTLCGKLVAVSHGLLREARLSVVPKSAHNSWALAPEDSAARFYEMSTFGMGWAGGLLPPRYKGPPFFSQEHHQEITWRSRTRMDPKFIRNFCI